MDADIKGVEVQQLIQTYTDAARGGDRSRFEGWLGEYAQQRCKVTKEGVLWDNSTKFRLIKSELAACDVAAGTIKGLLDSARVVYNGYKKVDKHTLYQLVVLENKFCLLFVREKQEWKVVAMFVVKGDLLDQWSDSEANAEKELGDSEQEQEEGSDDDYWDRYGQEDSEEDAGKQEQLNDNDYFAQYDKVETALVGDGDGVATSGEDKQGHVQQHIADSIGSLKRLALSSGLSRDEFAAVVMSAL